MIVQQYKLTASDPLGIAYMVTWLECGLNIGDEVAIKGMNDRWKVLNKFPHKINKGEIKSNWHVGGL